MKNIFKAGDTKTFTKKVTEEDTAKFQSGKVHNLYSTFALGRDVEWCTRLFVLDMKEEDEEGIGTFLQIEHISPAKLDSEIIISGVVDSINGNSLVCRFEARVGERLIAKGKTGQKVIKKNKLEKIFEML